ncbi:hypothetical protein OAN47_00560 [Planctomycetota bacterium]|nr:hypothetical protein [Planctomycetota bacterium]
MNNNPWIDTLRADFDKCESLNDESFLKLFPDGGLLVSLSGEGLPSVLLDHARAAADRPSLQQPPETGNRRSSLDDLLHEGLSEVADLLAHGVAEDLALAIAELQQWSSALESLGSVVTPSRSVFLFLEELEKHAENTPLDSIAYEALIQWRDERQIPEDRLIVAIDTILEQDQLGILMELHRIAQQQQINEDEAKSDVSKTSADIVPLFTNRSERWELREPLAAGAEDNDGTCWNLFDKEGHNIGSIFHDGEKFWSIELIKEAISVHLDDAPLESEDAGRKNWFMHQIVQTQPQEIILKYLEKGSDERVRLQSLRLRNSDFPEDRTQGTSS